MSSEDEVKKEFLYGCSLRTPHDVYEFLESLGFMYRRVKDGARGMIEMERGGEFTTVVFMPRDRKGAYLTFLTGPQPGAPGGYHYVEHGDLSCDKVPAYYERAMDAFRRAKSVAEKRVKEQQKNAERRKLDALKRRKEIARRYGGNRTPYPRTME